jgi:hypothetical protein
MASSTVDGERAPTGRGRHRVHAWVCSLNLDDANGKALLNELSSKARCLLYIPQASKQNKTKQKKVSTLVTSIFTYLYCFVRFSE